MCVLLEDRTATKTSYSTPPSSTCALSAIFLDNSNKHFNFNLSNNKKTTIVLKIEYRHKNPQAQFSIKLSTTSFVAFFLILDSSKVDDRKKLSLGEHFEVNPNYLLFFFLLKQAFLKASICMSGDY